MSQQARTGNQDTIVEKYFSDLQKRISLKKGDVLLKQYEFNERIYYVKSGKVKGFLPDKYITEPVFEVGAGSFVGVYSYFSEDHRSYSQVVADEPCEIYFSDDNHRTLDQKDADEFLGFLFKIVVTELRSRQRFAAQMAHERQKVMNKLIKTEKLATLGQLSAGLAHELNNSIGSLSANLRQLVDDIQKHLLNAKNSKMQSYFNNGLEKGTEVSSSEARQMRNQWPPKLELDQVTLKRLAKAGISPGEIHSSTEAVEAAGIWNLGNTLHDMNIAAKQAAHVIKSIKSMGIAKQSWTDDVRVNDTISESIAILRSMTRTVNLEVQLEEGLPPIRAIHGELVQVWINLIKNAVESLKQHHIKDPKVTVCSRQIHGKIKVYIEDNGPGIPKDIMEKIFEPSFTTKVEGISLGLGLGLAIVQRIVNEHDGDLYVESRPGETRFTVELKVTQP